MKTRSGECTTSWKTDPGGSIIYLLSTQKQFHVMAWRILLRAWIYLMFSLIISVKSWNLTQWYDILPKMKRNILGYLSKYWICKIYMVLDVWRFIQLCIFSEKCYWRKTDKLGRIQKIPRSTIKFQGELKALVCYPLERKTE